MATKTEDSRRVRVEVTHAELSAILIDPAKKAGYIDFDPTRIMTRQKSDGGFEITFEKVEGNADSS